ncbi:MAG: hypothetical protein KH442_06125 [Holdemanella biformis]|nr:hypothetical protein [Holdemanella biformis]
MNIDKYIRFDDLNKQFTIPSDTYSYSDVVRVSVLNEKAKYKEKSVPITAILPSGPLPSGILQNPYLFVGVKVVLKDETVLAIYVSKEKVLFNSDMYLSDLKEAKLILSKIKERIG